MYVVKLGGSLYNTPQLRSWLTSLANYAKHTPVMIVPGGGPFADQVREAQRLHKFSDSHAHQMAIMAMAQFGTLIAGLQPACQPVSSINAISNENFSVWLPDMHILQVKELTHSWDVTSDSLALWLAQQSHAEKLVLVKRHLISSTAMQDWQNQHIIDQGFFRLYQNQAIPTQVMDFKDAALFPHGGVVLQ